MSRCEIFVRFKTAAIMAQVASNIGVTYDNLGDYQRALESLQYGLGLRRVMGDRAGEGLTLNNIGSAYSGLAEYQKSLDAYMAAIEIHRSFDSRWNMAVTLNNIGWVYAALGDHRHALSSYQESLEMSRVIKDPRRMAVALNNIANIHAERGNYPKAIQLHSKALALRRQTNDPDGEANSLTNLGDAYAKLGEPEKLATTLSVPWRFSGCPRIVTNSSVRSGAWAPSVGIQTITREVENASMKPLQSAARSTIRMVKLRCWRNWQSWNIVAGTSRPHIFSQSNRFPRSRLCGCE